MRVDVLQLSTHKLAYTIFSNYYFSLFVTKTREEMKWSNADLQDFINKKYTILVYEFNKTR